MNYSYRKGRLQKAKEIVEQALKQLDLAQKASKKMSGARRKEARGCSKEKHEKKPRRDKEGKKEKEARTQAKQKQEKTARGEKERDTRKAKERESQKETR